MSCSEIYFYSHYNLNGRLTNDLTKIFTGEVEEGILGVWYKRCRSLPVLSQEFDRKCLILPKSRNSLMSMSLNNMKVNNRRGDSVCL